MDNKWKDLTLIDQKIKSIAERNIQLKEEYEALKMANKEALSRTDTDQVS